MKGYLALRESAAWCDATGRGIIRASGEDRARLLHAMVTNDVKSLQPGQGCYAFFLNAQGRVLADSILLCREDDFLLVTEHETRAKVYEHLDKFIIADDVTVEDLSATVCVLQLEGPAAASNLAEAGAPVPEFLLDHAAWQSRTVLRIRDTAFILIAPAADKSAVIEALKAEEADAEALRTTRLERGEPRYGEDISDRYLTQETGQMHAVSFNKGCYLGQEIVERVRSRAQIHRRLLPLHIDAQTAPEPGTKFTSDGQPAAELTSAAYSPALGSVVALAYVRTGIQPGATLESGSLKATVLEAPPAPPTESRPSR